MNNYNNITNNVKIAQNNFSSGTTKNNFLKNTAMKSNYFTKKLARNFKTLGLLFFTALFYACDDDLLPAGKKPAEKLTFQKITVPFSGDKIKATHILSKVQGKKGGYTLKEIKDITPKDVVTITGKAPDFIITINKIGTVTATLVLQHKDKKDATIVKATVEITRATALFDKTFGGSEDDIAYSMIQTTDGGYAMAGYTKSNSAVKEDVWVIKLDRNGNKTWEKKFGGSDVDRANAIVQTADGGYAVAGSTKSAVKKEDIWVIKLNSNGDKDWEKKIGESENEQAHSIVQTTDGGYAVAGYTNSKGAGSYDAYVIKLNSAGDKAWENTFGQNHYDMAYSIIQTKDGGYAVAGYTDSKGSYDAYVIKLNSNGDKAWEKTFGGGRWEIAYSIVQTTDGGYVMAGYTESNTMGKQDILVIKLDSNGNEDWNKKMGGSDTDITRSIIQTTDGGYAIAGYTNSKGAGSYDAHVIKLNSTGNKTWEKTFGGSDDDKAYSIVQTTDGAYAVAGHTKSKGAGGHDFWIITLDSNGNH